MSMNYFAVKTDDFRAVQQALAEREIVAILYVLPSHDRWPSLPDQQKWVVIAYPPPWSSNVLNIADKTVEITASDSNGDWRFRIVDRAMPLLAEFKAAAELISGEYQDAIKPDFDAESKQYLEDFFGLRWSELEAVMEPGKATDFCSLVGIPVIRELDQNEYGQGTPEYAYCQANGYACYAADVFGG